MASTKAQRTATDRPVECKRAGDPGEVETGRMVSTPAQCKAAEWLIEMKTAEDPDALWPAFSQWLEAAPENRAAYLEIEAAWGMGERALAPISHRNPAGERFVAGLHAAARRRETKHKIGIGVGVTLAFMVALVTLLTVLPPKWGPNPAWSRYETAFGEHLPIALADGSHIDLNTQTRLWVRLTPRQREVALEQGEAFFVVAHDTSRPFQVSVNNDVLRARGTEFSVRRESTGAISALVLNGSIEVPDHSVPTAAQGNSRSGVVMAGAGVAVNITPTGTVIEHIGAQAIRERLAWTAGNIEIDGTLAEAAAEFNRYNTVRLQVDSAVANRRIQGIFKATDPEAFAKDVQSKLGLRWSSTGSAATNNRVIHIDAPK